MNKLSMRWKITLITVVMVIVGFVVLVTLSLDMTENKVTDAMVSQFINETTQIAEQASIILEQGGTTEDLQSFVEAKVSGGDSYIAYAVVIDTTVTAIAHSDTEKIGKTYTDDTSYTVPAATNGTVMTMSFWADVQNAWTYDVMCPIYVNGELFGSMDVGVYNSQVSAVVNQLRQMELIVATIMVIIIGLLISILCGIQLKPFHVLAETCQHMGTGDFTIDIPEQILRRGDECGTMGNALDDMKKNLSKLLLATTQNSKELYLISSRLNESAENTQKKAVDIAKSSIEAVSGTDKQTELAQTNSRMTEEISNGMDDIANNIMTITSASNETATEASTGAEKLNVVVNQMGDIERKVSDTYTQIQELVKMSDDIQNVISLIADIASQTNLLSLNASIEAARAGEQGKGFAVVADQVGTLADQSKNAAADIGKIIQEIQDCINSCVKLMEEGNSSVKEGMELADAAKQSFDGIISKISQVSDEMTSVSAVTEEVTSGTTSLHAAINNISELAESVADNTQNISQAAQTQESMMDEVIQEVGKLTDLSQRLEESMSVFKIS